MGSNRSRDDRDDEAGRPRRRRRDDEYEDDYDDRPRSRRRRDDDEDDRPPRRPRRKSRGPSTGLILGIAGGVAGLVGVVVLVIFLVRGGLGGANISYEKFAAIDTGDTIESLEKKFGSSRTVDPKDWDSTYLGGSEPGRSQGASASSPLGSFNGEAREVTSWHVWKKGSEEIYVAEGTDIRGRRGLVLKVYWNPKILEDAVRNPGAPKAGHPWFQVVQIGVGGEFRFGG